RRPEAHHAGAELQGQPARRAARRPSRRCRAGRRGAREEARRGRRRQARLMQLPAIPARWGGGVAGAHPRPNGRGSPENYMASPKKCSFDVWLAQGKTVYRDVPYEVVTDWLQQGRLLGDDRIRPAKTEEWFLIEKVPAFAAFVPKVDPLRSDAKAEALEPMETGFAWGKPEEA